MQGLLEVIRVQRHDFMNHLQVISGLLQLEHYDRAREYIKQAAEELHQSIEQRENIYLECAEAEVSTREEGAEYLFQVNFNCREGAEQALGEKISSLEKAAAAANGGFRVLRGAAGKTSLTLVIPIAESEAAAALE